MKIKIEVDESIKENEIIIKCNEFDESIQKLQQKLLGSIKNINLTFYKDDTEYFFPVHSVLFFETDGNQINAHTKDDVFHIKNKLYELLEILPNSFVRISKSTIININHIYSINKGLTSSKSIQFNNTYKQVYVSRNYYRDLKNRLDERRMTNA